MFNAVEVVNQAPRPHDPINKWCWWTGGTEVFYNSLIAVPSTNEFTQIFKVLRSPFLFSDVSWIHRVPACIEQYAHCVLREPGKHLNLKKWKWKARGADTAVCQRQRQTQRQETKTQRQEHRQTKQHRKWKLAFLRKGLTCPQGVTRLAVENTPIKCFKCKSLGHKWYFWQRNMYSFQLVLHFLNAIRS